MTDSTDREAIVAMATDYIQGWLDGDAERMGRSLHQDLVKRTVDDDSRVQTLDRATMVELTTAGYGRELARPFEITILDLYRDIATVRVVSSAYVDHLQLVRVAEGWAILNVLWQAV